MGQAAEEEEEGEAASGPTDPQQERPKAVVADSDSFGDGMSDMGLSDASTFLGGGGATLRRQQTAPPMSSCISSLPALANDDQVVLRVKGTFMEAVQLGMGHQLMARHRSWSEGDLPQLCEVMDGMDDFEEEM
mmetsp:Transcript_2562/g.6243  ORF Transcript_2562/g.6243 Transcript_2562/m.6243 type:complete len:133 (-) Transcript_2562:94-492(-)